MFIISILIIYLSRTYNDIIHPFNFIMSTYIFSCLSICQSIHISVYVRSIYQILDSFIYLFLYVSIYIEYGTVQISNSKNQSTGERKKNISYGKFLFLCIFHGKTRMTTFIKKTFKTLSIYRLTILMKYCEHSFNIYIKF